MTFLLNKYQYNADLNQRGDIFWFDYSVLKLKRNSSVRVSKLDDDVG